jgi:DNA-binding response OmpR family regulator
MSGRVLVVEPDASGRVMLDRALTAAGYSVEAFASVRHARILLDEGAFDLAVVDQLAGDGAALGEVRALRAQFPRVAVLVTGTTLTTQALLDLLRIGVFEALQKPFTPDELRGAVARVMARAAPSQGLSLDHAAALRAASLALSQNAPSRAAAPLARAWAACPLDAEVLSLEGLRAELEGRDDDARRAWRAAIALRRDDDGAIDPHEGLTRLDRYDGARPVDALDVRFSHVPQHVSEHPLRRDAPLDAPRITVMTAPLSVDAPPAMHLRQSAREAFALCLTDARPERLAPLLARLGDGPLTADAPLDAEALREARERVR